MKGNKHQNEGLFYCRTLFFVHLHWARGIKLSSYTPQWADLMKKSFQIYFYNSNLQQQNLNSVKRQVKKENFWIYLIFFKKAKLNNSSKAESIKIIIYIFIHIFSKR